MELDDDLCLCFHVSKRKVLNHLRREKPQRASQLSECFGAGTGCGWCRPFLLRLWERSQTADTELESVALPDAAQYAQHRGGYLQSRKED